jgi:hypothetical protein
MTPHQKSITMRFLSYLSASLFVVLLAACGGGGGSPGTSPGALGLFTTAPATLTLAVRSAQEFSIGGGRGPYAANSADSSIAVAGVRDNTLSLGAVGPGSTQITLRDAAGATSTIGVTVTAQALFSTAPVGGVTLAAGAGNAQTYQVGGGAGPFTATSSNVTIVAASLIGSNLVMTGVAPGAASIAVRDSLGATLSIPVTVTPISNLALFTSAPASVTIAIGGAPVYTVGGGTPPYTATSSNTNVAAVSLNGGDLTIRGASAGAASVVIRDAAGATATIAVTIGGGTLTVNPSSATALIGDVLIAKVSGGRAPYNAVVSNTAVADASISFDGTLQVTVKQQAAGVPILISDADGLQTTFTLTSTAGQPAIQLSPSALTISELSTQPFTLQVYGATGGVSAFSSDTSLLTASASGNTVTVSTGSNGNRCVSGDTSVTISAVDAAGALATSVITIKNSTSLTCP